MHSGIRATLTVIALIFVCGILACAYGIVWPFLSGFNPCLSTIIAPHEVAAVRTRYQEFYTLNKGGNFEQAYQYTSASYRSQHHFEKYKDQAEWVFVNGWSVALHPDSSIYVCGNWAYLSIEKYEGFFNYGGYFNFVKQDGQWYVDSLDYAVD